MLALKTFLFKFQWVWRANANEKNAEAESAIQSQDWETRVGAGESGVIRRIIYAKFPNLYLHLIPIWLDSQFYFLKLYVFIWEAGIKRKRRRGSSAISWFPLCAYNGTNLAKLMLAARSSTQVPHVSNRIPPVNFSLQTLLIWLLLSLFFFLSGVSSSNLFSLPLFWFKVLCVFPGFFQ